MLIHYLTVEFDISFDVCILACSLFRNLFFILFFRLAQGAECNPGAVFHYLGVTTADYLKIANETEGCKDDIEWVGGLFIDGSMVAGTAKALGSVRASLGYMSRYEDVRAFVDFIRDQYSL